MNEMIERVARAILISLMPKSNPDSFIVSEGPFKGKPYWVTFVPAARATIAAMQEPTAEMALIGAKESADQFAGKSDAWDDLADTYKGLHVDAMKSAYRAMIDAAGRGIN